MDGNLGSRGHAMESAAVSGPRAAADIADPGSVPSGQVRDPPRCLLALPPEPGSFHLVSAQFMHLPPEPRTRGWRTPPTASRSQSTAL
jgi:hypothetical protein